MPESTHPDHPSVQKKRMPARVYVGSALVGLGVLGFLFFIAAFIQANALIKAGVGDVANFMTLLILEAIFLVGLPTYLGLRLLRRNGRAPRARKGPNP